MASEQNGEGKGAETVIIFLLQKGPIKVKYGPGKKK